jgi:hypothetical protein
MKFLKTLNRTFLIIIVVFTSLSCAELQGVINQFPQTTEPNNTLVASGLREALNLGIDRQVQKLTQKDGFFRNELVKILLPEELRKVDKALRDIGLSKIADEGLRVLNLAAEDAVKEATPIFVSAIKNITFEDAKSILLAGKNAATNYLKQNTEAALFQKFKPVIEQSFSKVGADVVWANLTQQYNRLPFTKEISTDLTTYVTGETLKGVYKMIGLEEQNIRTKLNSRTTDVLRRVFALQD